MFVDLPFDVTQEQFEKVIQSMKKHFFVKRLIKKKEKYIEQDGIVVEKYPSNEFRMALKYFPFFYWDVRVYGYTGNCTLSIFGLFVPSGFVAKKICRKLEEVVKRRDENANVQRG